MIDLKTRAVAPFSPDARTFHNIYMLHEKHVLLRHQSYPIVFMGNKYLRFWQIMPLEVKKLGLYLRFFVKRATDLHIETFSRRK